MSASLIDLHIKTLEILDKQLDRIFKELGTFTSSSASGYISLIGQANTIIMEITRLSRSIEISQQDSGE